jgi:hypothetical protein
MTSNQSHNKLSLEDLASAFGWSSPESSAEWYMQSNKTIPQSGKRHFDQAKPDAKHPVLLLDRKIRKEDPPTQTYPCWIRSASVYSKIQHLKHNHDDNKVCALNTTGWLVTESTFPISKEDLKNYFCDEPQDSKLLIYLRRHSESLDKQIGGV